MRVPAWRGGLKVSQVAGQLAGLIVGQGNMNGAQWLALSIVDRIGQAWPGIGADLKVLLLDLKVLLLTLRRRTGRLHVHVPPG